MIGTLLLREARRLARRPSTWLLRAGTVTVGLLFVLVPYTVLSDELRITDAQRMGVALFYGLALAVMLIASVLPAVLVAQALGDERDGGTLDLLALTPLSIPQIVWEKVASRGLSLVYLGVGVLPVLALLTTLGGIEPAWIGGLVLAATFHALASGSMGGLLAVVSRGVLVPTLATLGWFLAWGLFGPIVLLFTLDVEPDYAAATVPWVVPWGPMVTVQPVAAWWAIGPVGLTAAWTARTTVVLFRQRVADGFQGFVRWPEPRWSVAVDAAVLVLAVVLLVIWPAIGDDRPRVPSLAFAALVVQLLVWPWIGTRLYQRVMVVALPTLEQRFSWRTLFDRPGSVPDFSRPVWSNAFAWKELITQGYGAVTRVVGLELLLFGLLVAGGAWIGLFDEAAAITLFGWFGVYVAAATAMLLGTALTLAERQDRTAPLLALATEPPWRVLAAKWVGVGWRVAWLAGFGLLVASAADPAFALGMEDPGPGWSDYVAWSALGPYVGGGVPLLRSGFMVVWVTGQLATFAAAGLMLGAWIRPRGLAWGLAVALGLVLPLAGLVVALFLDEWDRVFASSGLAELGQRLALPVGPGIDDGGGGSFPLELVVSGGLWWVLAVVLLGWTATRWRAWALR